MLKGEAMDDLGDIMLLEVKYHMAHYGAAPIKHRLYFYCLVKLALF